MANADVPVISFEDYRAGGRAAANFTRTLGEALERFGFIAVADHGIDAGLLERAYALAEETFSLPEATKRTYETPEDGRQRGYTSFGVEHAKDQALPDLKEFWHIGRELASDHPMRCSGDIPSNRHPTQVPAFGPTFAELFGALDGFATALLGAIGDHLGVRAGFFEDLTRDGNSVLRIIHYPPLHPDVPAGAVRAAQHEDINLITILPVATSPGLQLLTRDGEWLDIDTPPGVMICDTGDMMQLITGGQLPSTTHRVINPPDEANTSRYSMPFFCHPHPHAMLAPIRSEGRTISARDFLFERLREIGVA